MKQTEVKIFRPLLVPQNNAAILYKTEMRAFSAVLRRSPPLKCDR
jgi:hypothetical protein